MKANMYRLLEQCVDTGSKLGLNRAFKHTDAPTDEKITDEIVAAVMQEICEWFTFEEYE